MMCGTRSCRRGGRGRELVEGSAPRPGAVLQRITWAVRGTPALSEVEWHALLHFSYDRLGDGPPLDGGPRALFGRRPARVAAQHAQNPPRLLRGDPEPLRAWRGLVHWWTLGGQGNGEESRTSPIPRCRTGYDRQHPLA